MRSRGVVHSFTRALTSHAWLFAGRRRALMWRALEDLDPTQRLVLTMNVIHEHSMPDIAKHLGISVNTGNSRLRLARAALRRARRAGEGFAA